MSSLKDLLEKILKRKKLKKYLSGRSQRNPNKHNCTNYRQSKFRPDVCVKRGSVRVGINFRSYRFDTHDNYNEYDA